MRHLLLAVLVALGPGVARADPFNLYGYGPRAAAMGGAMTAAANDYTAVFYNPALLVERKQVNVGVHFMWHRMAADVRTKDPGNEPNCVSCTAPDTSGAGLGALFPLGGKVQNRVALGMGFYLPSAVMLRLWAPDNNAPYWYRYNANAERLGMSLGAGVRIFDWLKVGAGLQVLADLIGTSSNVKVDLFSKQVEIRELDAYLGTRVAPVVGLHLSPLQQLRFGVTYRGELKLVYRIPATVDMEGVGTLGFVLSGVAHYSPHSVTFGAAWDPVEALTVSLDGEWQNWSAAPSPYMDIAIDLSGATLEALGLGTALDITSPTQKPGFADTFGGRLGLEYRVSSRVAARAGGFYRPTPVPRQDTAGTNLLDNSTVGATLGVGFNFDDPLEVFGAPLQIDLAGQAHFLLPREANKDPLADTTPSYVASATVFGLTAALRYDF